MAWLIEHLGSLAQLDDLPQIHHRYPVCHMTHDGHVVGNQDVGQVAGALQLCEQVEDLRLNRDIQRRCGFVEDDNIRVGGQGPGNGNPLTLAAGELVGEAVQVFRADTDLGRDLGCHLAHLCPIDMTPGVQRLGDDPPDRQTRVERRLGVLEHNLHVVAAFAAGATGPVQIAAAGRNQAHQQLRQCAFSTA